MTIDLYGKALLTVIAVCLLVLASAALTTKVHAADSFHCSGKLMAGGGGMVLTGDGATLRATASTNYGGYDVDVTCN